MTRAGVLVAVLGAVASAGCGGGSGDTAERPTATSPERPATTEPAGSSDGTRRGTTGRPAAPTSTAVPGPRAKRWSVLGPGDCLVTMPEGSVESVAVDDCAKPHAAEFVGRSMGPTEPGAACSNLFRSLTGRDAAASGLTLSWIQPAAGNQSVQFVCLASNVDGTPKTGSVQAGAPAAPPGAKEKPAVAIPPGTPPPDLVVEDLVVGTGPEATVGTTAEVHYVGVDWSTGREFDASWDNGETFEFPLGGGQVIQGWDQGVVGMKVGGRRKLTIPPNLGYGARGVGDIKPDETLVFVIDLVSVS